MLETKTGGQFESEPFHTRLLKIEEGIADTMSKREEYLGILQRLRGRKNLLEHFRIQRGWYKLWANATEIDMDDWVEAELAKKGKEIWDEGGAIPGNELRACSTSPQQ